MVFFVLYSPEKRSPRLLLIKTRLYHAPSCRRCQACSILRATRATGDCTRPSAGLSGVEGEAGRWLICQQINSLSASALAVPRWLPLDAPGFRGRNSKPSFEACASRLGV